VPATSRRPRQTTTYHSPLRERQAAATRQAVLAAATRLFIERGWAGTTLAAVAGEAGTAVETIYPGFGSKSGLLTCAIDVALVGDDAAVPLAERPQYARLGVGSRAERLSAAAEIVSLAHHRAVGLLEALREAAASDAAAAARWERYESDRRTEIAGGLSLILGRRVAEPLIDGTWALTCPEVYTKLVVDRGWPLARYQRWLVETVGILLDGADR